MDQTTTTGLNMVLNSRVLVPEAWQRERPALDYFVFNPAIYAHQDGWLMVYRVVASRYVANRLAACSLDAAFNVVPGSVVPLSDTIAGINQGIGDPRLVGHQAKIFLTYCRFRPFSSLHLVELDADTLATKGTARPLTLKSRQMHERNWMLFSHGDELLAVYTISPHVILRLDLAGQTEVACERIYTTCWDTGAYTRKYGDLRGGTTPIQVEDTYYAFFHSSYFTGWVHPLLRRIRGWLHSQTKSTQSTQVSTRLSHNTLRNKMRQLYTQCFVRLRYTGGFYGFAAEPPFAPTCLAPRPVLIPENESPALHQNRLRPIASRVVFPTGSVLGENLQWFVSYGVHDAQCKIRTLDHSMLLQQCVSVAAQAASGDY